MANKYILYACPTKLCPKAITRVFKDITTWGKSCYKLSISGGTCNIFGFNVQKRKQ